ncbi:MAG TPA: hypothetical protein VGB18_02450 [Candidatus Thermoplasmatota archaeon]
MRLALPLLVLILFGGCLGEGPILYLEYTLFNLGSHDREASPGPHCGTARVEDDTARVERTAYNQISDRRPFLIVEPDLGDGPYYFATMGTEGYPMALPAEVDPNIAGETAPITVVSEDAGMVKVDGKAVTLPHEWSREVTGNWRAEFRLTEGPGRVELFRMQSCM